MSIFENLIVPVIKTTFVLGVVLPLGYFTYRGLYRYWKQQWKWIIKYKVLRYNQYPEELIQWSIKAIDNGKDYMDVKKDLFIEYVNDTDLIYEVLFVFSETEKLMKGGNNNGRRYKKSDRKISTKFSKFS